MWFAHGKYSGRKTIISETTDTEDINCETKKKFHLIFSFERKVTFSCSSSFWDCMSSLVIDENRYCDSWPRRLDEKLLQ